QASSSHYALGIVRPATGGTIGYRAASAVPAPPALVAVPIPPIPQKVGSGLRGVEVLGPEISAVSAAVIDTDSGAVLFGKQPYVVRPLASITKLVTALTVVGDQPDWGARVEIIPSDIPAEGHTILRPGDFVTMRDLFTAMLVRSDNGAARALVRGHEAMEGWFRDAAAQTVRAIGLFALRVVEPTGLASENRGTAVDVARLLAVAREHREIARRLQMPQAMIMVGRKASTALSIVSTNLLLLDTPKAFRVIGGKTGYLDESGYNLALVVEHNGNEVVVVVLGSATHDDRFRDAERLAEWTFRNYEWTDANMRMDANSRIR
ncbi:MAG: serine hydrolase, partial [bacterium]|nr:serine hydrolase [bacterium]